MRSFQLYLRSGEQRILITDFDVVTKQSISPTASFDEKISFSDNDQITFTFSLSAVYLDNGSYVPNPWITRLHHHSILELVEDGVQYDLVISSIEPDTSTPQPTYNYTAKDYFSYILSRRCVGFSYNNVPDADLDYNTYPELYDNYGVESIFQIGAKILRKAYLYDWRVYFKEEDKEYVTLAQKPISLNLSDTTPYNALVEACNTLNCCLRVDYKNKIITFLEKSHIPFSGYRYRPEYNLRSLSVTYSGEELTTMLHVEGGKDENEQYVTITPYFPDAVNKWLAAYYDNWSWTFSKITNGKEEIINLADLSGFASWSTNYNIDFLDTSDEGWWSHIQQTIRNNQEYFLSCYAGIDTTQVDATARDEELQKLDDFFALIKKIPYAGQYILDLEFFTQKEEFSQAKRERFKTLMNSMTRYNIMLKDITYARNNLRYEIESIMAKVMGQGDIYTSIMRSIIDGPETSAALEGDIDDVTAKITSYVGALGKKLYLLHGAKTRLGDYPEIAEFKNKAEAAATQKEEYYRLYNQYAQMVKNNEQLADYTITDLEAKAANYESLYKTFYALGAEEDIGTKKRDGTYIFLYNKLTDENIVQLIKNSDFKDKNGTYVTYSMPLDEVYETYNSQLEALTGELYCSFGQYIVESKYTNSDEIDSVSLFNQAMSYFQDLYKPKAEYNIETINIRQLELISIPQLQINSKIRIYNDKIGLDDAAQDSISGRENELLVTSISYSLRDNLNVSIGVEQLTRYSSILSKLIKSVANQ